MSIITIFDYFIRLFRNNFLRCSGGAVFLLRVNFLVLLSGCHLLAQFFLFAYLLH